MYDRALDSTEVRRNYAAGADPELAGRGGHLADIEDDETGIVPSEFSLEQNYPNPFNPVTTITFAIPEGAAAGEAHDISLRVFDILGRQVATLVDDTRGPGAYSVSFDASALSSGMYIYRLTAGGYTATRRMMLVK